MILPSIPRYPSTTWIPAALALFAATGQMAQAQEFALAASPPRFELAAKPGQTTRAVVELDNASSGPSSYSFSTAEWVLAPDGGVTFDRNLKVDSCRPWVAIERREATLPGNGRMRYRFEITPPADAPAQECRFAILVSGTDERLARVKGANIAISGQVAIIVYVAVGDVKPILRIVKADIAIKDGVQTPVLMVENTGTAHGRLSALLSGVDARGRKRDFAAATLPVLPGETRMIPLTIDEGGDAVAAPSSLMPRTREPIVYPLRINGTISDTTKSFRFEGVFAP